MIEAFVNPIPCRCSSFNSTPFGVQAISSSSSSSSSLFSPWIQHVQTTTGRYRRPTRLLPTLPLQYDKWIRLEPNCEQKENENRKKPERELSAEVKELRSILKKCSLYLIGPMGCGKSAIGKYLANELGFRFLDTDELIENVSQKSVSKIFEEEGESYFRDLESMVLEQVCSFIGCCVATGGGIILKKENWGHLQTGIVIYLNTPVDVLHDRLMLTESETQQRPLLKDAESLRDRIKDILFEREHLYKQADVHVNIKAGMPIDDIGKEIIRVLTNFIKSNPPKLSSLYPGNLPKN